MTVSKRGQWLKQQSAERHPSYRKCMRVKNTRKIEVKRLCRSFLDLNAFDLGESLLNLLRELARLWSPKLSCKDAVEIPLSYITGTLDITSFPRPLLYNITPPYNNIICIHVRLLYTETSHAMNIIISEQQEVRTWSITMPLRVNARIKHSTSHLYNYHSTSACFWNRNNIFLSNQKCYQQKIIHG